MECAGGWRLVASKYLLTMALEVPPKSSELSSTSARKEQPETARRMAIAAMLLDFKIVIRFD
jgi:hypothetical protein